MSPRFSRFVVIRTIVITSTIFKFYPYTRNQFSVFRHLVGYIFIKLIATRCCSHRRRAEIVPLTIDLFPTTGKLPKFRITIYTCIFIKEYTCELGLIFIDTILTEVIVETVNFVYAKKLFAVNVVSVAAFFYSPAFFNNISQSKAVFECCVCCTKPSTGFTVVRRIGIYEGFQSVNFLIFGFLCEGVKCVCSKVALIAEVTCSNNIEAIARSFKCAILRSKFNTLKHAKGICLCRINSLCLVDPVKCKCESICLFIKCSRCEREIVVHDFEIAVINDHIVVEINSCCDLCKNAYTFSKLEQEVPSRSIGSVCTGKHIDKIIQLRRNRDLSHIDCEDVRCFCQCFGIDNCICHTVNSSCVENIAEPCELTVTACCQAKVKCIFTLLEHIKCDSAANAFVILPARSDLNNLCAGIFATNEDATVDSTVCVIFKDESNVSIVDCNRLVIVACRNGKTCICTVDCIHMCFCKVDIFRNNDIHFRHTYDLAIEHHTNLYCTISQTSEYTVCGNSCKAFIGNCPSVTFGKFRFVACRANTLSSHLNGSTDCRIAIIAFDYCVIEFCRAGSCGNHHKRCRNRACKTVRRFVNNAEFCVAGLSCNICCRTAAVEVDRLYAASFEHDLCDFLHATTAGEGFLTSVKYHKYNLTCLCDTNSCSGCTASVIVVCSSYTDFAILDKHSTKAADSFCQLTLVCFVVFLSCANESRTVLRNTEEAVAVNAVVFFAVHYKQTARFTSRHIEAVSIYAGNNIVIGDIIGTIGVTVLVLSRICLILNTGHFPTFRRIVIVVVCINVYVASGNICSSNVINHLLAVCGCRVVNFLRDAWSKLNGSGVKYVIIGVICLFNVVACELAEVICERIANCTSECNEVFCTGKISSSFESSYQSVSKIFNINSISYLCTSTVCLQSVCHEVCRTVFICKFLCHIVHDDLCQRINVVAFFDTVVYGFENVHDVICVKVAIIVFLAKARIIGFVNLCKEAILANESDHCIKIAVNYACCRLKCCNFEKVNKVACPTGNVCVVGAKFVVICNIHRAEYVTDISLITIGESKVFNILKTCNSDIIAVFDLCIEFIFNVCYVFSKVCIFVTCHNAPRAGVIAINTSTDVLDYESYRVLCGICLNIFVCHLFEKSEIINKVCVIVDGSYAESRKNYDIARSAAFLACPMCFITVFCTCRSFFGYVDNGSMVCNCFLCNENLVAFRAVLTFCKTGVVAVTLNSRNNYFCVTFCRNFVSYIAVAATIACISCIAFFCASGICYN